MDYKWFYVNNLLLSLVQYWRVHWSIYFTLNFDVAWVCYWYFWYLKTTILGPWEVLDKSLNSFLSVCYEPCNQQWWNRDVRSHRVMSLSDIDCYWCWARVRRYFGIWSPVNEVVITGRLVWSLGLKYMAILTGFLWSSGSTVCHHELHCQSRSTGQSW